MSAHTLRTVLHSQLKWPVSPGMASNNRNAWKSCLVTGPPIEWIDVLRPAPCLQTLHSTSAITLEAITNRKTSGRSTTELYQRMGI